MLMMRVGLAFVVLLFITGCFSSDSKKSVSHEAIHNGDQKVTAVSNSEGRVIITSLTSGTTHDIVITDSLDQPLSDIAIAFHEKHHQKTIHVSDPDGYYADAFIAGNHDELNDNFGPASIQIASSLPDTKSTLKLSVPLIQKQNVSDNQYALSDSFIGAQAIGGIPSDVPANCHTPDDIASGMYNFVVNNSAIVCVKDNDTKKNASCMSFYIFEASDQFKKDFKNDLYNVLNAPAGSLDHKYFSLDCQEALLVEDKSICTVTTGRNLCPLENGISVVNRTGVTDSITQGDDGYYQNGMKRSFIKNSQTKIVTDMVTSLMWIDDYNQILLEVEQETASNHCNNLTYAGYDDWRLPYAYEIYGITDFSGRKTLQNFFKEHPLGLSFDYSTIEGSNYWVANSSYPTTFYSVRIPLISVGDQTFLTNSPSFIATQNKQFLTDAFCIRGENFTKPSPSESSPVPVEFPYPGSPMAFPNNKTGLWWLSMGNKLSSYEDAIKTCESGYWLNHSDWYLPNINELLSSMEYDDLPSYPYKPTSYSWSSTIIYPVSEYPSYVTYIPDGTDVANGKAWALSIADDTDEQGGSLELKNRSELFNFSCVRRFKN